MKAEDKEFIGRLYGSFIPPNVELALGLREVGISPAEWTWREEKGFMYIAEGAEGFGLRAGCYCMNCHSEVILIEAPRENCPNDECYNFARGIDFWKTGEEWLRNDT